MPITEDQCDDISERTAKAVHRQILPILKAAMHREAMARAQQAPGSTIVPWDLTAGLVAGVVSAAVEMAWAVCPPEAKKTDAHLPALFAQLAAAYVETLSEPPGSFIRKAEANEKALADKRRRMT